MNFYTEPLNTPIIIICFLWFNCANTNFYLSKQEIEPLISRDFTSFYKNFHLCKIDIIKFFSMGDEKMRNDLENFDFLELGQAIQNAREKQLQ